jgi:hypothetical protein
MFPANFQSQSEGFAIEDGVCNEALIMAYRPSLCDSQVLVLATPPALDC